MNITEINTPADLESFNKHKSPEEVAVEAMLEVDYEGTKRMVNWLLNNIIDYHKEMAVKCANGEHDGSPLAWAQDVGTLNAVQSLFQGVE